MRFGLAIVRGRSMLPGLRDGDRLLVRYGRPTRAGGLVLVRLPREVVAVKRLTALAGPDATVESDNVEDGYAGVVSADDLLGTALMRVWPRPRRLA